MAARTGVREEAPPGSILIVIHDFYARSDDELSLAKGDRIELIERDDDFGDGWFLGRHMGIPKTGLFPEGGWILGNTWLRFANQNSVYTTPAPKGNFANASHQRRKSDGPPKTPQLGDGTAPTSPLQQQQSSSSPTAQRPSSATNPQLSSASPMAQMALRTSLPSVTSPPVGNAIDAASPVMSETLSVIDEHMNDMNAPVATFTNGINRDTNGGSNVTTPQPLARFSYIAGHETDEEEHQLHTEEEVMAWTPERVAEYLEDSGVERAHCDIFKEQEISGEVLLAMEQSSIFLKEFELGSVGRRLKTWHKVRALQDEAGANAPPKAPRSASDYSGRGDDANGDASRNRASTMGSILPRALETSRQSVSVPGRSNTLQSLSQAAAATPSGYGSAAISPLQGMNSMSRAENTYRPSAQTIRQMQHSRRHSSIDSTSNSIEGSSRQSHRKQPSLDQEWQPGQMQTNGNSTGHSHTLSAGSAVPKRESLMLSPSSPSDLDRGYFSSNELDSRPRTSSNVLKKKTTTAGSPMHSRNSSYVNQKRRSTQLGRISGGSMREALNPGGGSKSAAQGIFSALNSVGNTFGSIRSATTPQIRVPPEPETQDALSPVVTKLDHSDQSANDSTLNQNDASSKTLTASPTSNKMAFFSNKPKMTGLRTISDAITRTEKMTASPVKEGALGSPVRTGSTTPSTDTRSIDLQKSEIQSRASEGSVTNLALPPTSQRRIKPKTKTKKATSAYTRGLEQKTPAEQIEGCDYSGWMKKKSGSLMTTWKTRLFVLRGRRLSYYYTDTDTEEKGLIDISFHRVLPAHNETLTGLHATFTGAVGSPASPKDSTTPTTAQEDLKQHPAGAGDDNIFIFKLVPPKTGLSKGVNFTRPTVHYFAVNSRQEGRLWMAALMKATIDRDEDGMVTTTYNQKTITLAKARARRERPPALREDDTEDLAELGGDDESSSKGLGIGGLSEKSDAVPGAEEEKEPEEDISLVPVTTTTSDPKSETKSEAKSETKSDESRRRGLVAIAMHAAS